MMLHLQKYTTFFRKNFVYLLIFLFAFTFRYCLIQTGPVIQIDEPSSFYCIFASNRDENGNIIKTNWDSFKIDYDKDYSVYDIQNLLFSSQKGMLWSDLSNIRRQSLDKQHPSLYFGVLRIWCNYLTDFNYSEYIKHARSLNLIFFCISFFFMYKLLSLIKNSKVFISSGLIFAFLLPGSMYLSVLAREYSLQETSFIAISYVFCSMFIHIKNNQILERKLLILAGFIFALCLSSGYLSLIYLMMLFLILICFSVYKRNKSILLQIFLIIGAGSIITLLFCPNYFNISNNEHYLSMGENIPSFFNIFHLIDTERRIEYYLTKFLFLKFILLLCFINFIINFLKRNKHVELENKTVVFFLLAINLIWSYIIMSIVPYNFARFILPAFPILSLIYALLILYLKKQARITCYIVVILFTLMQLMSSNYLDGDRDISFTSKMFNAPIPVVFNKINWIDITYLFVSKNSSIRFVEKHPDINLKKEYLYITDKSTPLKENNDVYLIKKCVDRLVYFVSNY